MFLEGTQRDPFGTRPCGARCSVLYALSALPPMRVTTFWTGKRVGFAADREKIVASFHQPAGSIWIALAYLIPLASVQPEVIFT